MFDFAKVVIHAPIVVRTVVFFLGHTLSFLAVKTLLWVCGGCMCNRKMGQTQSVDASGYMHTHMT